MSILNMVENIKKIHKEDVAMIKIGKFHYVYGKDAYILSYLFKYKIKRIENNMVSCAFPEVAMNKVLAKLEKLKVNYLLIDRRNQYDVYQQENYKNLNQYQEIFEKAKENIKYEIRIEKIYEYLINNKSTAEGKEMIRKMEEIINERRKV